MQTSPRTWSAYTKDGTSARGPAALVRLCRIDELAVEPAPQLRYKPAVQTRPFGRTGLQLPSLVGGASSLGQVSKCNWRTAASASEPPSIAVALIDTLPFYGSGHAAEVLLGIALKEFPGSPPCCTKTALADDLGQPLVLREAVANRWTRQPPPLGTGPHLDIVLCHDIGIRRTAASHRGNHPPAPGSTGGQGSLRSSAATPEDFRSICDLTEVTALLSYSQYTLQNTRFADETIPCHQGVGFERRHAAPPSHPGSRCAGCTSGKQVRQGRSPVGGRTLPQRVTDIARLLLRCSSHCANPDITSAIAGSANPENIRRWAQWLTQSPWTWTRSGGPGDLQAREKPRARRRVAEEQRPPRPPAVTLPPALGNRHPSSHAKGAGRDLRPGAACRRLYSDPRSAGPPAAHPDSRNPRAASSATVIPDTTYPPELHPGRHTAGDCPDPSGLDATPRSAAGEAAFRNGQSHPSCPGILIHPARKPVHPGLGHVADHRPTHRTCRHKGAVADGEFGLVPVVSQQGAKLVGHRHQRSLRGAAPGIFLGRILRASFELAESIVPSTSRMAAEWKPRRVGFPGFAELPASERLPAELYSEGSASPRTWPGPRAATARPRRPRSQSHRSSPARRTGTHTCGRVSGSQNQRLVQERFRRIDPAVAHFRARRCPPGEILRKRRALRAQDSIPRYATLCPSKTSSSFPPDQVAIDDRTPGFEGWTRKHRAPGPLLA